MQPFDPDIWPIPTAPQPDFYPQPASDPGFHPEPYYPQPDLIPMPLPKDPDLYPFE